MRLGKAEKFQIAIDAGAIRRGQPVDQHLPLRQQQRVGAIQPVVQADDFVTRGAFKPRCPPARAHQHDRGDDRKDNEPDHRQQDRNFMAIELARIAERRFVGAGQRRTRDNQDGERACRQYTAGTQNRPAGIGVAADALCRSSGSSPACPCAFTGCRRCRSTTLPSPPRRSGGWPRHPANQTTLLSTGIHAERVQIMNGAALHRSGAF